MVFCLTLTSSTISSAPVRYESLQAEVQSFSDYFSWLFVLCRIQRMTTVLNEKEDSLRKLKETLRRSQQQGEESSKLVVLVLLVTPTGNLDCHLVFYLFHITKMI